ncbi:hypothetical protein B0H11DRAFT_1745206, partial [Mycena galericulata]
VGIAAQIPSGASLLDSEAADLDYNSLWQFLLQGGQAKYFSLPFRRWSVTYQDNRSPIRLPTHGCLLKNAENFDNLCFGVSVKDARVMPFSARRLLDLSFRALEDSGINSRGQNVGCFMSGNQHLATQVRPTNIDADGSFAWLPHALANRISYALDLTGPSMTIDTACNSSLTALHLAISALQAGECSAALVGAAQINRDFFEWQTYVQGGVSSPNGICKPFDASANGFGRGEGVIAVVLKPLAAALRDNDRIYAEIVGSAINATGSRLPLNVPSGSAQEFCIREAFRKADIDPEDADYVELHATGTAVGDPIEVNAAGSIFAGPQTTNFGSIKGNIGHLELTAFLASLAKACLIFEHGIIPPTVNFSVPNPSIHWHDFNIAVPREPTLLGCRSSTGQSTISISAAGLGGSTGHVVLQGPRKRPTSISPSINSHVPTFFIVGGQSAAAAEQIARASCAMDRAELQSVSVTLARRARQLPWRTCFISSPSAGVIEIPPATLVPAESPSLVYVFSGQGPQNLQMARQLFAEFPVFRDTILELDNVCRAVHGSSVIETTGLFSHDSSCTPSISLQESGWPVVITVSAIAMVQIALFDLLKSVGVLPEMVLGHSAGETTALYASGAGSKAMALEVAIVRGEAMTSTEKEELGMVALGCGEIRSIALIARAKETVDGVAEISCYNAPESVSVSGNAPLLNKIVALAKGAGILAQRIRTMVPGHSSFMDTIKEDYIRRMEDIWARYPGPHKPVIPVLSTCRKDVFVDTFTPSYFWDNCRNPVLFSKAIGCSLSTAHVYVEISSHPVLSTSVLAHGVLETRILCPMRRLSAEQPHVTETTTLLNTLGRLSLLGMNAIDLSGIYGYSTACPTTIKHPLIQRTIPPPKSFGLQSHHASQRILSGSHLMLSAATHPDLAEHVISGEPIFPATAYIELLLEQGVNYLWDMEFKAILSIPSEKALAVELDRHESSWSVRTNAVCLFSRRVPILIHQWIGRKGTRACVRLYGQIPTATRPAAGEYFYPSLQSRATYGLPFQRLVRCNGRPTEVIAEIEGLSVEEFARGYTLHPVILDACLHIMLHRDIARDYSDKIMYLPTRLEHFTFYRRTPAAGNWYSHLRLLRWAPDSREYDVVVLDANGEVLCEFKSLVVKKLRLAPPPKVTRRYQPIIQPVFIVAEIPTIAPTFSRRRDHDEVKKLGLVLDEARRHGCGVHGDGYFVRGTFDRSWRFYGSVLILLKLVADLARNVPHAYMHAKAYDVGKAPESQGFLLEDYDVVVSLHVLHAAPDLAACLASLRQLLVPGGILLTVELDGNGWASKPGSIWFDCIFGSFPEWFGILEACNFVGVQTCSEHGASGREFFFIAQKPTGIRFASTPSINLPDVYRYKFGREMELKKWILAQSRPTPVYIIVQHGHDAQAATGLCAGLRKDIPSLQIRLCIFASPAQIHNPSLLISRHLNLFAFEDTIYFNHAGTPLVPRVAPAASPAEAQAPPTASDLVSVKVNCWAEGSAPRQGFVGTVLADHPCGLSKGEFVAAVQDIQEEDIIFVPPSVLIHTQRQSTGFPHDVLASVLVSIIDASLPPRKSTLVLAVDDDNLSCSLLGKFVTLPLIEIAELDWKASHIHASVDILFTDSRTYSKYPHLRRWIRRSGKLVLWDRLLENALREDPNFVAHILSNTSHRSVLTGPPLRTRAIPREKFASPPFRPDRAYILLGGIGGLGADLAVWMYQNGARHLILTSRRGIKSLDSSRDTLILAKFAYLLSQEGLTLRLEACDGTKTHAMAALLNSIPVPIAGCFHMTLVLSDSHFAAQTESSFRQVFDSKVKVLNAFAATIDITSLDFFVAFSSLSGLVGMPGQSNYASACTALEGALSRYPNAFSLVTPGIFDAGYLVCRLSINLNCHQIMSRNEQTSCSPKARSPSRAYLWACLADGLQFLDFGPSPLSIYIPALDWQALDRTLTLRASCRHLIPSQHASALPPRAADGGRVDGSDLKSRVVELLELSESDFDARQPLVNYGLDSLSASKLSSLLKPFAQLSQLQLLGGLTWTDIEELLDSASEPSSTTPISRASPPPVMQPEAPADVDIFVEICSGPGIPLILLPGATGSTSRFLNLRGRVKGAVWGINITLECPLGSLHELVVFLSNQIRRRFPCGPYRIGSFCATSAHTIALVKLLEDSGQDVQQLIFLDHFPLMWVHADHEDGFCRGAVDDLLSIAKEKVILMLERDPSISPGSVAELRAAIGDAEDSAYPEGQVLHRLLRMIFAFMEELYPHDEEFSYVRFVDAWTSWVSSVKAPFALVIAEHGLRSVVPNTGDWANYGAGRMEYEVPIHYLDNVGHWGIFSDDRLATVLDGGEIEGE